MRAGAFLDRDGVVNIDHGYVFRKEDFQFVAGTLEAARLLKELGFALVIVTNQAGIARGMYSVADFQTLTDWMRAEFASNGAALDGVYYCPHHPTEGSPPYRQLCRCRKPQAGLLLDAARDLDIDLGRSVLFGDKASDLQAGSAAGVPQRVLLGKDGHEVPEDPAPAGLATARYRSLQAALKDPSMRIRLARCAAEQVDR